LTTSIPVWRNARADIGTWVHGRTASDFIGHIVEPSIRALDLRIEELGRRQEGAWAFEQADLEDLRGETLRGFALALQSFWERQLRTYLAGCASEFGGATDKEVEKANWADLQRLFLDLRGLALTRFSPFPLLDLLQQVGNVCRHGEGPAATRLRDRHPELWPDPYRRQAGDIVVDPRLLTRFAGAIAAFWTETEDIYVNSLRSKHPSTERRLREAETRWGGRG